MTKLQYIELRNELRHASWVRLDRAGDPIKPRIFNARRTKEGRLRVEILRDARIVWETCRDCDEIVVSPGTRNEYVLLANAIGGIGAR